jgi:hypothetical protein
MSATLPLNPMYAITMLRFNYNFMICRNVTPRGLGSNIVQRCMMKKNSLDCNETNNNICVMKCAMRHKMKGMMKCA